MDDSAIASASDRAQPAPVDDALVEIRNLKRVREGGEERFELHVPNLWIARGAFVAVVGESGCGKSTLLDMLGMVLRPSEAERFVLSPAPGEHVDVAALWHSGDEASLASLRRLNLGYVLQTGGLFPFLTVEENIRLQARLAGREMTKERIDQDTERLEIDGLRAKKPSQLSGGQRQRTAILRALSHDPSIVLADEPTAAVDLKRAAEIMEDFKFLARTRRVTVVVVTHAPHLVEKHADAVFGFDEPVVDGKTVISVCREMPR